MRAKLATVTSVGVVALLAAGCGASATKSAGSPATVAVKKSKLGIQLADAKGKSLYLFEQDKSTSSTCYAACASTWPPYLTTGKAKPSGTAVAGLIGTTKRKDGGTEVTYNGHPLYYYSGDKKADDSYGQGLNQFGAQWYVLAPKGDKIDKS